MRPTLAEPQLPTQLTAVSKIELDSDCVIEDVSTSQVLLDGDVRYAEITGSQLDGVQLTGSLFENLTLVDVVFQNCELSGVSMLLDSNLLRVRFNECRMSGFVGSTLKAKNVAFNRCKLDDVNMRMSSWQNVEFVDCELHDADFMGASFENVRFQDCRLQRSDFSRAQMREVSLHGSELDGIVGATSLSGCVIGSNQVLPLAEALLAAANIRVDDDA